MKIRINTPLARIEADLQEDQVKDLLRIALQYATGEPGGVFRPIEAAQPAVPAPRVFTPVDSPKPKETRAETAYKGFLYIKCDACGKMKGYCARTPTKESRCDCGCVTPHKDLKPLYVKCKCGENFKYMTNLTDDTATMSCIHCGAPVDLEYHGKKGVYETVTGEE